MWLAQLCHFSFFVLLSFAININKASSEFIYGKHFPNGVSAVNYIYNETHGTWKQIKDLQYIWNYYEQYATPSHPYDKGALIAAANGSYTFTARDANGYLLCDSNDNLEIDSGEISCGWAFHEHNGRGVNNSIRGGPFTQFWLDDNWLARYMSIAYDRPQPSGLVDHPGSFMRWKAIAGDVVDNGWVPYNSNYFDTLALDGLYYIALGNHEMAVGLWRASLIKSKAVWNEQRQVFDYPEVHENYHMGLWKIFTEQLISCAEYLDPTLTNLLTQHGVSQRVHILDNQEKDPNWQSGTGWISNIGQPSSLINTEGVSVNALALGANSKYVFEVTESPMVVGTGQYIIRSSYVLSAVVGVSSGGLMSYGRIALPSGRFTVEFCLRSSFPVDGKSLLEVYDYTEALSLAKHNITLSDFVTGSNDSWTLIPVDFISSEANHTYEFRTFWSGLTNLDIAFIKIR